MGSLGTDLLFKIFFFCVLLYQYSDYLRTDKFIFVNALLEIGSITPLYIFLIILTSRSL